MYKNSFATLAFVCLFFVITVNSTKKNCPTICAATSCIASTPCDKPNEEIRTSPQDVCGCCPYCVTILGEGEKCDDPPFVNGFATEVECSKKDKLICKNGICQKYA